jgi:phosphatidylglycerol---prolipoprotein diacylglyceryl transferase
MNPIALTILGFDIRWYGILISLGILIGILITRYTCNAQIMSLLGIIVAALFLLYNYKSNKTNEMRRYNH